MTGQGRGGDAAQVAKAIAAGAVVGPLLAAANVYMGLKVGFTSDGSLVAAIVAVAITRGLGRLWPSSFGPVHTNLTQAAASAGAFCAVAGLTNAVPAMARDGVEADPLLLVPWVFFLAVLGVSIAAPLRRRAIELDKLTFPSGVVAAEAITLLHAKAGGARRSALSLGGAAALSGAVVWLREAGLPGIGAVIPPRTALPGSLGPMSCASLSIGVAWSPALAAIGAIVGLRTALGLALGAALGSALAGPLLAAEGLVDGAGGRSAVLSWTLWPAVGLITGGGLAATLARPGQLVSALAMLRDKGGGGRSLAEADRPGAVPRSWWVAGLGLGTIGSALVARAAFGVPLWQSLVAVLLALPLAVVAIRAVGETDISPSNNLAKVTQLVFAALAPGQTVTNVAAAGVASGCAIEATEVMTDLKAGHLLGNRPRDLFVAQVAGIAASAAAAVVAYSLLVRALPIGSEDLPAPTAMAWSALARALSGDASLPAGAAAAGWIGAGLGALLTLVSSRRKLPLPSPVALGLGAIFPASFSVTILLGALLAWAAGRGARELWERNRHLVPSGLIVGESLVGLLAAALQVFGVLGAGQ